MSTATLKYAARLFLISALVVLCHPCSVSQGQTRSHEQLDTLTLCFVSDTQEPMFFERVYLTYNNNAQARKLIFGRMCELRPTAVVHLGDLVSLGSDGDAWREVDEFVKALRERNTEFSPIPGNHEYLLFSSKGISNFRSRYPYANLTGYSRQYANVAVLLVNSNFDELSEEERNGQLRWYRETLVKFENDSTIDFVIVGCHHSPFTNSKIVGVSEGIRSYYLPEFFNSVKCRLFVSGHAHAYEHFKVNEKDFLVIGGSGGLQHPLSVGKEAEYKDLYSDSLEKRMFHFLTVQSSRDTLAVVLNMLKPDFSGFNMSLQLTYSREKSGEGRHEE
jgi:3',5'-cyclic AMP phosphodiesterase CpdA